VLTGAGLVHRISGLDPSALCGVDNVTAARDLLSRINTTVFNAWEVHQGPVHWFTSLPSFNSNEQLLLTVGAGVVNLCIWKRKNNGEFEPVRLAEHPFNDSDLFALTRVCATRCGEYIAASDTDGGFSLWSVRQLILWKMWSVAGLVDFVLVETAGDSVVDRTLRNVKVVMITKTESAAKVAYSTPCNTIKNTITKICHIILYFCLSLKITVYIITVYIKEMKVQCVS